MKYFLCLAVVCHLYAMDIANSDQVKPIKSFGPPKPISPHKAQSHMIENQFDKAPRQSYYFVTKKIDDSMDLFHLSSGFYGKSFYDSGLFKYRGSKFYTILNANFTKANSYKDGGGEDVNFGYKRFTQSFVLGYITNESLENKFTFIHDDISDDKQPHYKMDPIKTERFITKFNTRLGQSDLSNTFNLDISYMNLKRKSTNFDLRPFKVNNMNYMNVDRSKYGISGKYDNDFNSFHNTFGIAYQRDEHTAKRYKKRAMNDLLNAYKYGDIYQNNFSIFDTISYKFDKFNKLSFGLDYLYNNAEVKKFDINLPKPVMMGGGYFPNLKDIVNGVYGKNFDGRITTDVINAKLIYDFTPNKLQKYNVQIARINRIGSNNERFTSLGATMPGAGFAGDPFINPEKHNFIKLGIDIKNEYYKSYLNSINGNGLNYGGYLMADYVNDLIIYDRARYQSGILQNDNSIVIRNVEANIYSANAFVNFNFLDNFGTKLDLIYSYGQNKDDNRPLYQIRPFEANLNLDYKNYAHFGSYNLGTAFRYVSKQNRGDFDKFKGLGIDLKDAAKEFTAIDLYAGINISDTYGFRIGVNNIFDRQYAEFISGNHVEATSPILVNAPGRVFYLSFHGKF